MKKDNKYQLLLSCTELDNLIVHSRIKNFP